MASVLTLPQPITQNGLNYIPGPSPEEFDAEFGGLLPPGETIPSSWGSTRCYTFAPTSPATGRNIVLVQGGGTSSIGMAPLAFALADKGENVVTYDTWGHGCSSTPLAPHVPALYHHQLLEVLSHLQWTSAHILGFSLGGSVLTTFAVDHPKAVKSLTLVAPAGLLRKADRSWYDAFIEDGGWGREWFAERKIVGAVEGDARPKEGWKEQLKERKIDTNAVQAWQRERHAGHKATIVGAWRNAGVFDLHGTYRSLAERGDRALVVLGGEDSVFPETFMRKQLKSVGWKEEHVKAVKGATHEIVRSHIKEVVEVVEEFWKGSEDGN